MDFLSLSPISFQSFSNAFSFFSSSPFFGGIGAAQCAGWRSHRSGAHAAAARSTSPELRGGSGASFTVLIVSFFDHQSHNHHHHLVVVVAAAAVFKASNSIGPGGSSSSGTTERHQPAQVPRGGRRRYHRYYHQAPRKVTKQCECERKKESRNERQEE
jgi:hypothetical protein